MIFHGIRFTKVEGIISIVPNTGKRRKGAANVVPFY